MKDSLDRFYTHPKIAALCVRLANGYHDLTNAVVIEPSAGAGAFLKLLPAQTIGLDLAPASLGIEQRDFLAYRPIYLHRNVILVGNPPFGRSAALAIAFVNQAAQIGHTIAMVLPRSFRKASVQNRLDSRLHLVAEQILPPDSFVFEDRPYDVPCVFQIWRRTKQHREPVRLATSHPDFDFTGKDAAAFAVQRVGANAGRIKIDFAACSQSSHYFIKPRRSTVLDTMRRIDFDTVRFDTAGNPSIGKGELVALYDEVTPRLPLNGRKLSPAIAASRLRA